MNFIERCPLRDPFSDDTHGPRLIRIGWPNDLAVRAGDADPPYALQQTLERRLGQPAAWRAMHSMIMFRSAHMRALHSWV